MWTRTNERARDTLTVFRKYKLRAQQCLDKDKLSRIMGAATPRDAVVTETLDVERLRSMNRRLTSMRDLLDAVDKGGEEFGVAQMVQLEEDFSKEAGSEGGALNRSQFCSVLARRFRGLSAQSGVALTGAMFDASDEDGSGDIDIEVRRGCLCSQRAWSPPSHCP